MATVDPGRLAVARATIDRVIEAVDTACISYRNDSDLARVNAAAGHAVPVSGLFVQVVRAAMRAAELTNGMVDPTAARYLEPGGPRQDWWSISLSGAQGTASVPAGVALDLGAVGKAFAADTAARLAAGAAGLCAELLPELIARDEWGYPIIKDPAVPDRLQRHARQAERLCPKLALRVDRPQ